MIALIDGDSLIYKIGFTFQETIVWNEDDVDTKDKIVSTYADLQSGYKAIDSLVDSIMFKTNCDEVEIWLTKSGSNFRHVVYSDYKHNRKASAKPILYDALFEYLIKHYNANVTVGYEADDMVVYLKTTNPSDYFLCAIDKDVLYQTVGNHYNYNKEEFIKVNEKEADRFAYYQCLVGDTTDGYPGCPGIGDKKATKLLDESDDYWKTIVETYKSKGLTEYDAIVQMRLANMHQFNGKIIELWTPKNNKQKVALDPTTSTL